MNETLEINNIKIKFSLKGCLEQNDELQDDPEQNSHFVLKQNPNKKGSENKRFHSRVY